MSATDKLTTWARKHGLDDPTADQVRGFVRGRAVAELTFLPGDDRGPAVVIAWKNKVMPWLVGAIGPFPSKAAAQRYGRKHYPRAHVVVGLFAAPEVD